MKPINQKFPHTIDNKFGDCWAACAASVLEIKLDEIPDFFSWRDDPNTGLRFKDSWLLQKGYLNLILPYYGTSSDIIDKLDFHVITVPVDKDYKYWHCVVGKGNEIVHDPNPRKLKYDLNKLPWFREIFYDFR